LEGREEGALEKEREGWRERSMKRSSPQRPLRSYLSVETQSTLCLLEYEPVKREENGGKKLTSLSPRLPSLSSSRSVSSAPPSSASSVVVVVLPWRGLGPLLDRSEAGRPAWDHY